MRQQGQLVARHIEPESLAVQALAGDRGIKIVDAQRTEIDHALRQRNDTGIAA